jgi:diguanylate cyclase (GGDEF)-like protein/PAS domain S-box-containing protein
MWQSLFANLAVVAIALVAWTAYGDLIGRLERTAQSLLFGAGMAAGIIGSMTLAYEPSPGIFYDLRGPLITLSGYFGGPFAAIIAVAAALAYRIYLGGSVAFGVVGILVSALVGLAGYALHRPGAIRYRDLLVVAVAAACGTVAIALVRSSFAPSLANLWAPVSLNFIGTLLLGSLLLQEDRQRALARSNLLYRSMVDALPDCLNIKDGEGRFLAANPATARLMRARAPDDLIGKTDFDFYAHDLAAQFHRDEQAVMESGENRTIEQPTRLPDGRPGWLLTLKALVRDDDGRIVGLITHNRDITQRKTLQLELEATQAQLDEALANMTDGLAMYDQAGVFLFCNNRYQELFPRTAHLRKPGTGFADIIRASVELGEERLPAAVGLEKHLAAKLAALREDGERLVELVDGRRLSVRTKVVANGSTLMVVSDVTERWHFQKDLEYQALHDPLTGLPNRAYFNREFGRLLEFARRTGGALVVMLVDLDHFKEVNDRFGHPAGDALLVEVSRRLEKAVRRGDFVARLGGDEFAVLMSGPINAVTDVGLASRISRSLTPPMHVGEITLLPSGTIGYTTFPRDNSDADGLLRNADRALYLAKNRRRGSWMEYDPTTPETTARAG